MNKWIWEWLHYIVFMLSPGLYNCERIRCKRIWNADLDNSQLFHLRRVTQVVTNIWEFTANCHGAFSHMIIICEHRGNGQSIQELLQIGYAVRFDDKTSNTTKIKYLTDGMLLREALIDPLLKNYKVCPDGLCGISDIVSHIKKRKSINGHHIASHTLRAMLAGLSAKALFHIPLSYIVTFKFNYLLVCII